MPRSGPSGPAPPLHGRIRPPRSDRCPTSVRRPRRIREGRSIAFDAKLCSLIGSPDQALGGGVTRSLALDAHGKSLSSALLDLEIEGGFGDTDAAP
jgi:hypothetical protein